MTQRPDRIISDDTMRNQVGQLFEETYGRPAAFLCRAPGRIEFIGNHTDYNGGAVLGAAIDRGVWVAIAPREDGKRLFRSDQSNTVVELSGPSVRQEGGASWVNYPLGVLEALTVFGLEQPGGFEYAVCADLPVGAGLSSSAAIELASGLAFLSLTGVQVERETLVKIGRHAENNFVGVPCGILDQGVSGFGKVDQLVYIDCAGPRFDTVPMPEGTHFWIFNTHTKHALVDGLYSARHAECMEAAKGLGVELLAAAGMDQLDAAEASLAPVAAKRARHIIGEIGRVEKTISALNSGDMETVGHMLTASHRSSQHLFENSTKELDFLVDVLEKTPGVYGARLTGGGFGGAVMALTEDSFGEQAANEVRARYADEFQAQPQIIHLRTADGAEVVDAL